MLAEYLAEGPYRFSMAFGRGKFEEFWGATAEKARILEERRRWLGEDEARYLAVLPGAEELLKEAEEMGRANGTLGMELEGETSRQERDGNHSIHHGDAQRQFCATGTSTHEARGRKLARILGEHWEPDWLVLKREAGVARLVAGCVCFPSSWSLEEKIGRPIEEIHGVVPGLNASVGKQIGTFLDRIKPGISWTRNNWGLSRSAEWNQHPSQRTARLDVAVELAEVFFRVEEQSLVALPRTEGILFGIRLKVISLAGYKGTEGGLRLARALETMPEAMAQYKGLAAARERIATLLKSS